MSKLDIGSRVVTGTGNDRKGVVMFLGQTKFAAGDWVGIRLDKPDGKNDGSVGGDRYFECEPMHGLFVKPAQVKLDKDAALADSQQKLAALRERRKKREDQEKVIGQSIEDAHHAAEILESTKTSELSEINEDKKPEADSDETIMTKEVNESSLKLEAIQSKNETINDSKEFLQLREELSNLTILLEKEKKESEDLQLKLNSLVNSSKAKESEISSLLQENEKLKNSLKDQENNLLQITNLKKQLTQIESQSVTDDSKQNMKTIEEFTAKVTAYEEQIAELMDTIEFLTLDKEQLMVEKELLDESLKRLNSSEQVNAHAVTSDSTQQLIEENGKLREALRRLNQLSASESSKHETDIKNLKEELNNLRKNHIDSSRLSEENHQLKEEIEELRAIVDASASYESMIESLTETNLNLTQRLQQTKESLNDLQTEQELMEELDSRQRQEIEDIRRELDQARVALLTSENVSKALNDKLESSKMIEEKFKRMIDSLRVENYSLSQRLAEYESINELQERRAKDATNIKLAHLSLSEQLAQVKQKMKKMDRQLKESQILSSRFEVALGSTSIFNDEMSFLTMEFKIVGLASSASESCDLFIKKFVGSYSQDSTSFAPKLSFEMSVLRSLLLLLRCTYLCWNAAITTIFNSDVTKSQASISSFVSTFTQDSLSSYVLNVSKWLESVDDPMSDQLEEQLLAIKVSLDSITEACHASESVLQRIAQQSTDSGSEIIALLADELSSSYTGYPVYTICQVFFYIHSIYAVTAFIVQQESIQDKTAEYKEVLSTIRSDVSNMYHTIVSGITTNDSSKVNDAIITIRNALFRCDNVLSRSLLMSDAMTEASSFRSCSSSLKEAAMVCSDIFGHNVKTQFHERIHFSDVITQSETLWIALGAPVSQDVTPLSLDPTSEPTWKTRCAHMKQKISEWEDTQSTLQTILSQKRAVEDELNLRKDELKAALSRCEELSSTLSKQSNAQKDTKREHESKLKEEIKMLTEAMELLEKRYDGLEKENKILKGVTRSTAARTNTLSSPGELTSPMKGGRITDVGADYAGIDYAHLLLSWRGLALTRVTGSLAPLPEVSVSRYAAAEVEKVAHGNGQAGLWHRMEEALRVYNDVRQIRSSIRVFDLSKRQQPHYKCLRGSPNEASRFSSLEEYYSIVLQLRNLSSS